MKVGIVLYSNDPEVVWNAFRFANFAIAMGDSVKFFLIGNGVESVAAEKLDTEKFKSSEQLKTTLRTGGKMFACGTCLEMRKLKAPPEFTVGTLKEMYEIVKESDKVLTF